MKPKLLLFILIICCKSVFGQSPYITAINPASGQVGTTVTISGRFFNATSASNVVLLGGIKAKITATSTTSLKIIVPPGAVYKPVSVLNTANGLTGYSQIPFLVTADSKGSFSTADIEPKTDFTTGYGPSAVTMADIDGDGKLDIAVLNSSEFSNAISLYKNTAQKGVLNAASFAVRFDQITGNTEPTAMALQDLDGDGKPELITINKKNNSIEINHNNAVSGTINAQTFGAKVSLTTITGPEGLTIGDIDGDGKPDIIISNNIELSILLNKTITGSINASSFVAQPIINTYLQSLALADLDNDGRLDIMGVNSQTGYVSILHNIIAVNGAVDATSFEPAFDLTTGGTGNFLTTADLNNDGKLDLILVNKNKNTLAVLQNIASGAVINTGSFSPAVNFTTGNFPYKAEVGDIDGDGLLDIIVPNYGEANFSILHNVISTGEINSTSFVGKLDFKTADYTSSVAIGDIDGDGRSDIAATNSISVFSLFHNNPVNPPVITSVSPLSGPVGTSVTITGLNFNKRSATNNIIYFGATRGKVVSATDKQIVVTVPQGATYQPISVLNTETQRSGYSITPFITTYEGNNDIQASDFENPDFTRHTSSKRMIVQLFDIDGDGKPDQVSGEIEGKTVHIGLNTGSRGSDLSGQFNAPIDFTAGNNINQFRIGDIDGDGKPDIVSVNSDANSISILRNISTPGKVAFAKKIDLSFFDENTFTLLVLADVNIDGKLDLLISNSSTMISICRNTSSVGLISFAAKYDMFVTSSGLAANDIDGDGKPDLIFNNADADRPFPLSGLSIMQNTSINNNISFAEPVVAGPMYGENFSIADVDNDGKPDVITAHKVFKNIAVKGVISAGSMAAPVLINQDPSSNNANVACTVDINGDGKIDMVSRNEEGEGNRAFSIFRNTTANGSISFDYGIDMNARAYPLNLAAGDIDGDSKPDILLVIDGSMIIPYYNQLQPASQKLAPVITSVNPATAPIGASVTITGNNFNPNVKTGNIVTFGDVNAKVTSASASKLVVTVPAGATFKNIAVTNTGNKRVGYSSSLFSTSFNSKNSLDIYDFNAPAYIRTSDNNTSILVNDIDGDGKLDMVVMKGPSAPNNNIAVYRNISVAGATIGASSFAPKVDIDTKAQVLADIDGDGKADLITNYGDGGDRGFSIKKNISTPGKVLFAEPISYIFNGENEVNSVIDIDGDGLPDLVSRGVEGENAIMVSQNTTRNNVLTFATKRTFAVNSDPITVCVGDFDGDGKPDIITTNGNGTLSVLHNTSLSGQITPASFDPYTNINIGKENIITAKTGDIDGDGKLDLIVASTIDSTICILRNTSIPGKISFAPKVEFRTNQINNLFITDMDGDGKPDIVVNMSNNYTRPTGVSIFRNLSTPGNFSANSLAPRVDIITGDISNVNAGDLDGDGKPDLIIAINSVIALYQNNPHIPGKPIISAFAPLNATRGTMVTIKGTDFTDASSVTFGGTAAQSFKVLSPTAIIAVVASGTTGLVSVTTPLGTASLKGFKYGDSDYSGIKITPLADVVTVKLDESGKKTLNITDLAEISNSSSNNPVITLTPASLDCSKTGTQIITVKVDDAGSPFNPGAVKFSHPSSVVIDLEGNMYVSDAGNYRIRKINPAGLVSTLAGNGTQINTEGNGINAGIATSYNTLLAVDPFSNLYATVGTIRKIDTKGNVTTIAKCTNKSDQTMPGSDQTSSILQTMGIAVRPDGTLFVVDNSGNTITKVTQTGVVTLLAGVYGDGKSDGQGTLAAFSAPKGIAIDDNQNLYVADGANQTIRKITPSGMVSTFAGSGANISKDGTGTSASFLSPNGVATDHEGNVYITEDQAIRKITPAGVVTTLAGLSDVAGYVDGKAADARFNNPAGLAVDVAGNVYIADYNNNCIRKIDIKGMVSTYAGGVTGYADGSIGGVSSSATVQIKLNVLNNLSITNAFADQLLPLNGAGKAIIPDYTAAANVLGSCGGSNIKVTQFPAAGTELNAESKALVTITAADASGASAEKTFTVTADVNKVVVFGSIPDAVYGDDNLTPGIIPPKNSTVILTSSNPGVATIVNNQIHIIGAGITTINATSQGAYINSKSQQLNVKPAPLTITANNQSRFFGLANPSLTVSYQGFVNTDTQASLTRQPDITTTANISSESGDYPIAVSGAVSANYIISYVAGIFTITDDLPQTNFNVSTTSVTCKGANNGLIKISAQQHLNYTATISGNELNATYPFTESLSISNLAAGTYNVCITINGWADYQQCYTLLITEPKDLSVYVTPVAPGNKVNITLNGGDIYNVNLNGTLINTSARELTLSLAKGKNTILISTDKACQGVVEKQIIVTDGPLIYPNPFDKVVTIAFDGQVKLASINVFNSFGKQVYTKSYNDVNTELKVDLASLKSGLYILKLSADNVETIFKLIKK
ncbi:MAG: C-terminal target protein [Mucilaginibacter sp.]|nr:C-terminal target protein [Mucilaginibacter sp.]